MQEEFCFLKNNSELPNGNAVFCKHTKGHVGCCYKFLLFLSVSIEWNIWDKIVLWFHHTNDRHVVGNN